MIDVTEAIKIIEGSLLELPAVQVPLEKALGRVLRQKIVADSDFPPYNRVMMDGIAIDYQDLQNGITVFNIMGVQAAGDPQMELNNPGDCIEVMTGAVAPLNSNVVIPYEEVLIDEQKGIARVQNAHTKSGKNIHLKGTDKKPGEIAELFGPQPVCKS